MDAAGYDAVTPGNHDWSYGAGRLAAIDADAGFAVLAANVLDAETGEPLFEAPYLLREVALADSEGNLTGRSATVGVFGVIDDILAVSPYGNALATYEMTGGQVLDAIERSLAISAECREVLALQMAAVEAGEDPMRYEWPKNSGSVLAVGGAVMKVDWARPDGQRVVEMTVGGEPLDAARVYTVALNSYLPGVADTFPTFAQARLVHEYGTCEEALRALIGRDGWEREMERISGSVTYVTHGDPLDPGPNDAPGPLDPGPNGTPGAGAHGLPSTGDASSALGLLAGAGALASVAAARLVARRER